MSKQNNKLFYEDIPEDLFLKGDLAIDTEAMGLNFHRDRLCLIQMSDEDGNIVMVKFGKDSNYNAPFLKKILTDKTRQKIFHFARFDVGIIMHYLKIDIRNIFCTKIGSKFARTYTDYHGLKTLLSELLKVDIKKDQQCSDWGAEELTVSQRNYAANDVIHLHKLRDAIAQMLEREGRLKIAQDFMNFIPSICQADILGFTGDIFSHLSK